MKYDWALKRDADPKVNFSTAKLIGLSVVSLLRREFDYL